MRIEQGEARKRSKAEGDGLRRMILIAVGVLVTDQSSKAIVRAALPLQEAQPVLPPFLYWTHVENTGAAFGLFADRPLALALVTLGVVAVALFGARRLAAEARLVQWAAALGVGGAVGNMIDRLTLGAVTDFVDFRVWPVFNVADVSIVVGVTLLFVHMLRGERA